jgi:hypothetical protein
MWVVIHKYVEAMLGVSLYSYLYLKLMLFFPIIFYDFSSTKSENKREEQVLPRREGSGGGGGSTNKVYICE